MILHGSEPVSANDTCPSNTSFHKKLSQWGIELPPLGIETLQLNITKLCNQTCVHCHVDASPRRREMMDERTMQQCIAVVARNPEIKAIDITGGAPELHPRFQFLVKELHKLGRLIQVRHNLTVTLDPHPLSKESMIYLPEFFAEHRVEVISSLPCYQELLTDKQRGAGVYKKSIESLQALNRLGYGKPETGLILNLVYNPGGPHLPPDQKVLENEYRSHLRAHFNIEFNALFAMTNMPIHRFRAQLVMQKEYDAYMALLHNAFNPAAAEGVMCRRLISVSYDGRLFDCDFNQMMNLGLGHPSPLSIFDFDAIKLAQRRIAFGDHCFGCTAGAGSSCSGATK